MSDSDLPDSETEAPTAAELEAAGQNSMFGNAAEEPLAAPAPEAPVLPLPIPRNPTACSRANIARRPSAS